MNRRSQRMAAGGLSELNITPLLDLCFVLLIIFMISTPLIEQQIPVNLPDESAGQSDYPDPGSIQDVTVDARGQVYLNGTPIGIERLKVELERMKAKDKDTVAALRADEKLQYQKLVDVLGAIRAAGVKLGLATTPGDS